MSINEFFQSYANNMQAAAERDLSGFDFECAYCPLRKQCEQASEQGDEMPCNDFIASLLTK